MFLNYVLASDFFVRNILWTHIEIWLNQRNWIWWYSDNSLNIQEDASYWNQYDLVAELDKANTESDRLYVINSYIAQISNISSSSNVFIENEQKKIKDYNVAASDCEKKISGRNSDFSKAVKAYDYELAENIAEEIAELRACIAKNQVYAKAHASYISFYNGFSSLQRKAEYLSNNKEKIAKYYEILKPDLLKELYSISQTVKTNF